MKNEKFNRWYDRIPVGIHQNVRKEIISDCDVSEYVFRNWRNDRTAIPTLAKKAINIVSKRYNLPKPFEK